VPLLVNVIVGWRTVNKTNNPDFTNCMPALSCINAAVWSMTVSLNTIESIALWSPLINTTIDNRLLHCLRENIIEYHERIFYSLKYTLRNIIRIHNVQLYMSTSGTFNTGAPWKRNHQFLSYCRIHSLWSCCRIYEIWDCCAVNWTHWYINMFECLVLLSVSPTADWTGLGCMQRTDDEMIQYRDWDKISN